MFYHKKCNGAVFLDNNTLRILSEFTITQKGIKPTLSEIIKVNGAEKQVSFVCRKCDCNVEPKDIMAHCFNCGNPFDLDNVFKVVRHSGFYCASCTTEYIGESVTKKPISSLLKFYTGNGGRDE